MSPRPRKKRCCEGVCPSSAFKPVGISLYSLRQIILFRDELEVLKLCDLEGLFQEQAGERMGVSRGTVQRLLASARRKTADALVSGAALVFAKEEPEASP
ncbi:DUF134 domain-containing protein [Candidatus Electronema sp. PJ]|uniref:DUF134 domain-containing protein n=1 Tax=Candidatus Electronema sp. PJ TaxID=3401572 RepID=UPI003AA85CD9